MKSRGVVSEKEQLSHRVKNLAKDCKSLEVLTKRLSTDGLEPYYRNNILTGLWLGNRKFRLTTLGIGIGHLKILTKQQERLDRLQKRRDNRSRDIDYEP